MATSSMTPEEIGALRAEIARFTLRRTKAQINRLVDRSPESYRHAETGRTCRYPVHLSLVYDTAESDADQVAADNVSAPSPTSFPGSPYFREPLRYLRGYD